MWRRRWRRQHGGSQGQGTGVSVGCRAEGAGRTRYRRSHRHQRSGPGTGRRAAPGAGRTDTAAAWGRHHHEVPLVREGPADPRGVDSGSPRSGGVPGSPGPRADFLSLRGSTASAFDRAGQPFPQPELFARALPPMDWRPGLPCFCGASTRPGRCACSGRGWAGTSTARARRSARRRTRRAGQGMLSPPTGWWPGHCVPAGRRRDRGGAAAWGEAERQPRMRRCEFSSGEGC